MQTVLHGVEVWGGSISSSTWNEIENMQQAFLHRHLSVKPTTPYLVLLLEIGRRPIEFHALIRVMQYLIEVEVHQMNPCPQTCCRSGAPMEVLTPPLYELPASKLKKTIKVRSFAQNGQQT